MIIYVLTVVYNKRCADLAICKFFESFADKNVIPIIYDNSTIENDNAEYCKNNRFIYLGGKGNVGISKSYNETIDFCRNNTEDGYICFFDDDATPDTEYFTVLRETIKSHPESRVFFPILMCKGKIISPAILSKIETCHLFNSIDEAKIYSKRNITAVNSAMTVCLSVYKKYRYDEKLFLDSIDHSFMKYINAESISYTIIDYQSEHELSSHVHPQKESTLKRYSIFCKDMSHYLAERKLLYWFIIGKRMLRLTFEYRTLEFIKIALLERCGKKND